MPPKQTDPRVLATYQIYRNIDEHISALKNWDVEIAQLDCGAYGCTELAIAAGDYQYIFMHHNRQVLNRAHNPSPGFQFCFQLSEHHLPHNLKYWTDRPTIFCIPPGYDIDVIFPGGFEGLTLFISYERYYHLLEQEFESPTHSPRTHGPSLFFPDARQHRNLNQTLKLIHNRVKNWACAEPQFDHQREDWLLNITEQAVAPQLLQIISNGSDRDVLHRPERFQKALKMILDNLDSPPSIGELSAELQTTQRNLQYLFKKHLGMPPKQLSKLLRINVARTRLWQTSYKRGAIVDIANQLGYWHMGGFSQEFRRVFLLNPSDLLGGHGDEK